MTRMPIDQPELRPPVPAPDPSIPLLPARRTSLLPARRTLLLGAGTLSAGMFLGTTTAQAATTLRRGDRGSAVTTLQRDLGAHKYWCGTPDGSFGHLTQQAVFALQKAAGLTRDGVVGARTRDALTRGVQPRRRMTSTIGFEVDLARQLLITTNRGRLAHVFNTSTGSGERYYSGGRWKTATTPRGDFKFYSLYSSGWQSGPLGNLYRPGYYDRGWAIHGSNSIPTYPDSHGCCRISVGASDLLWSGGGWFVKGRRVLIY